MHTVNACGPGGGGAKLAEKLAYGSIHLVGLCAWEHEALYYAINAKASYESRDVGMAAVFEAMWQLRHPSECGAGPAWAQGGGCRGRGPACDTDHFSGYTVEWRGGEACVDKQRLRACINGREHVLDCSQLATGFRCQRSDAAAFCGLGSECEPGEKRGRCRGDHVVVCDRSGRYLAHELCTFSRDMGGRA